VESSKEGHLSLRLSGREGGGGLRVLLHPRQPPSPTRVARLTRCPLRVMMCHLLIFLGDFLGEIIPACNPYAFYLLCGRCSSLTKIAKRSPLDRLLLIRMSL
jgi:hypothetical protein